LPYNSTREFRARCEYSVVRDKPKNCVRVPCEGTFYDQETKVRQVPIVLAEEESEEWKTEESRYIQQHGGGDEARTRGSVFQTALDVLRTL
jgi:hypothetical protein